MAITFTVGRTSYTWAVNEQLRTICGSAEIAGDDQERTVSLIGDRLKKIREGKSLTVRGTLRVVHHEAYAVSGFTSRPGTRSDSRSAEAVSAMPSHLTAWHVTPGLVYWFAPLIRGTKGKGMRCARLVSVPKPAVLSATFCI
ncbi:unnamed protein product [Gemmata massiliana]|uniref:Uncharacterized protein n=1 Tax=Gemmata massiliana TaxID=1210884 RepID=A0A6P2D3L9_9BACT|nr:unnamed protein product [Gemmata massiliana]